MRIYQIIFVKAGLFSKAVNFTDFKEWNKAFIKAKERESEEGDLNVHSNVIKLKVSP